MQYAPIALFTYNRADHTKQAVESLLKNEEAKYSDLFIFSDGPKNEKAAEGVKANRTFIRSLKDANDNDNVNHNLNLNEDENEDYDNDEEYLNHNLNLNENPEPLNCTAGAFEPAHEVSDLNSEALAEVLNQRETQIEPACKASDLNQTLLPECRSRAFKSVTIIEREKNWGLANSLIAGITEIVNKYGRVIVVEDDLILSPYFLKYMNDALEKYENEDRVGAVSAYVPTIERNLPETYFLYHFHCWGWGTWRRAWDLLETDSRVLLRKLRFKRNKFDVDGSAGAYGSLYCQKVGLVDSWWVRFYASLFIEKKLILYPRYSLVTNNGQDGTGTHVGSGKIVSDNIHYVAKPICVKDITIEESKEGYEAFKKAFSAKKVKESGIISAIKQFKSFFRRLFYIDCL